MKTREDILKTLRDIRSLPTLPDSATRVLALADDPDSSHRSLADAVDSDPSIATRLLKLVNSPYFGIRGTVTSIQQALVFLGVSNLRNLVLSSSAMDLFSKDGEVGSFSRKDLWLHSLATAIAARELAKATRAADPEVAFTAGLIHDVGKVVIDRYFHDDFKRIIALMDTYHVPMLDAEAAVIGIDHSEVGRFLTERWSLPKVLQDSVGCHHEPRRATSDSKLAALIGYADHVARKLRLGQGGGEDPVLNDDYSAIVHLSSEDIDNFCLKTEDRIIEQIEAFIDLAS
ncbi:HDOD domain-containing protein [bacterium]|nr:HDOD domain-containing protein [bacterium]